MHALKMDGSALPVRRSVATTHASFVAAGGVNWCELILHYATSPTWKGCACGVRCLAHSFRVVWREFALARITITFTWPRREEIISGLIRIIGEMTLRKASRGLVSRSHGTYLSGEEQSKQNSSWRRHGIGTTNGLTKSTSRVKMPETKTVVLCKYLPVRMSFHVSVRDARPRRCELQASHRTRVHANQRPFFPM